VDQISGTTPKDTPPQVPDDSQPAEGAPVEQPGFGSRGRARRRARFLRKARELAYRDLGGLVFNLHRFGQRNDALVLGKLATLGHIDSELRTIEATLGERRPITVLREAGITACPRCAAIHGSEDRFCPNCGLPMARGVDLPVAGAPAGAPASVTPPAPAAVTAQPTPAAQPTPTPPAAPVPTGAVPVMPPAAPTPEPSPLPVPESSPASGSPASAAGPYAPSGQSGSVLPGSEAQHSVGHPEESTEIIHPQAPGA
jgi:hypothetical protein